MSDGPEATGEWQIVPSAEARRDMRRLPEKVASAVFEFVDGPLRASPRLGKQLRDPLAGYWSARRGDYRVICQLRPETRVLFVVAVLHRRDAYRIGR